MYIVCSRFILTLETRQHIEVQLHSHKESKNISIKMLKDVEMTVPKSRETSAVYICSKTGDEGSIYAARQGMRASNMRNFIIKEM